MPRPALTLLPLLAVSAFAADPVEFNRDIRPVLADNCFHCHGPDPGTRKAGLRLDTEAGFFAKRQTKDGKEEPPTIIKGSPDKSSLYQRIISKDADEVMPPPETHKSLKPAQVAKIKAWIEQGAPWQPHWSLLPPVAAQPPADQSGWAKNPIDAFVLAKLKAAGLKPAEEADARTLIRRLALDVTGLPPSPELLAKHLPKDGGRLTDAQVRALVDELMATTAYGEHRARYWLDAARYADSHGLHFDNPREMWPYRDWVVKSFNANQPFDQFTVEQIAGDLLPNPTESQLIATGLQRCNPTTNEGGTIVEENLANYAADRVQTMGWVYFGLTTNCAQCHDHKFDPFTTKDFYSLAAFFRNTTQPGLDGNVKDGRGPVIYLPSDADRPRWNALPKEIESAKQKANELRNAAIKDFDGWFAKLKPADLDKDIPTQGLLGRFALNEGAGVPAQTKANGAAPTWIKEGRHGSAVSVKKGANLDLGDVGNFDTKKTFSVGGWFRPSAVMGTQALVARMDDPKAAQGWSLFLANANYGFYLISKWPNDAIKVTTTKALAKKDTWQHVVVTYDGSGQAEGIKLYVDGVMAPLNLEVNKLTTSSQAKTPTRLGQRSTSEFFEGAAQEVRFYDRALSGAEANILAKVDDLRALLAGKPNPKTREKLLEYYIGVSRADVQTVAVRQQQLEAELKAIKDRSPLTHIQEERKDMMPSANILLRGAYDKKGDQVAAEIPAALGKLPADAPKNRLGLARWLVSEQNTLTARVTVNRMWQELFGQGIVKTSEDFGIMGALPTHPELLDWLAVEFRRSGWDVKAFYRLMLTSATYRQAAIQTPEKVEKDRDNSLLSRGPRFRMDAEMIRDQALAASGTLSPRMGGPGTKPYQPENIWEVVGVGIQVYRPDKGENLYRRSLYNYWRRMAPPASLDLFNAPSREVTCVRRDRTNTPLQALVTLNDPQYVEASRQLAQRTLLAQKADDARFQFAAERVLVRPLKAAELAILRDSLAKLRQHYTAQSADAEALLKVGDAPADPTLPKPELAAWTMLCSQLFNLDEVLNK
jgi:mono/diheme cytochrome c family protein